MRQYDSAILSFHADDGQQRRVELFIEERS
jgi:hypothetical protein